MDMNQHPRLNPDYVAEEFDEELLLYSERNSSAVYLNDTAQAILSLCSGEMTIGEIIDLLENQYPNEKKQIIKDTLVALETLKEQGILLLSDDR